jgi:hypothetical protein
MSSSASNQPRARLLPSLFNSPRLWIGSAGASPSRENETALRAKSTRLTREREIVLIN